MKTHEPDFLPPGPMGEIYVDIDLLPEYCLYNITNNFCPPGQSSETKFNLTLHVHKIYPPAGPYPLPVDTRYYEDPGSRDELTVFVFNEDTQQTQGKKKYRSAVSFSGND